MRYLNPFWHVDRSLKSSLTPTDCVNRLRSAQTSSFTVSRSISRGKSVTFYKGGFGAVSAGPLFNMHVRVTVVPTDAGFALVRLRFSGGFGSSVVLTVIAIACLAAFSWGVDALVNGNRMALSLAAVCSILIPPLLVGGLSADANEDESDLTEFVAEAVEAH